MYVRMYVYTYDLELFLAHGKPSGNVNSVKMQSGLEAPGHCLRLPKQIQNGNRRVPG